MREILFRGKLKANGEWAYGCLKIEPDKSTAVITPDDTVLGKYGLVDPDTVGQFTGLTDKNGVKIYEGDLVQNKGRFGTSTGVILFRSGRFMVDWKIRSPWTGKGISARTDDLWCGDAVVGNIHDNPELLGVENA